MGFLVNIPGLQLENHPAAITVLKKGKVRQAGRLFTLAHTTANLMGEMQVPRELKTTELTLVVNNSEILCVPATTTIWRQDVQWMMVQPVVCPDNEQMRLALALPPTLPGNSRSFFAMVSFEKHLKAILPEYALQVVTAVTRTTGNEELVMAESIVAQQALTKHLIRHVLGTKPHTGDHHCV